MTRRIKTKRTQFKPNGKSGVIAGQMLTRGCHWIKDELPTPM